MQLTCTCGQSISDTTDALSDKAHYFADQDWFSLLDRLETLVVSAAAVLSG